MFERFGKRARRVVALAEEEARELHHDHIGTGHLLLGLLREGESAAALALADLGVGHGSALAGVVGEVGRGRGRPAGHILFTPRAKDSLEQSLREALLLGHKYIGAEHLLLGLLPVEGTAGRVLRGLGVSPEQVRRQVYRALDHLKESRKRGAGLFGRFDSGAQRAVVLAQEEARELRHDHIGAEHLLLGLLLVGGTAAKALHGLGIQASAVRGHIGETAGFGEGRPEGHIPFNPEARRALSGASREAALLGHDRIGAAHLLLGLVRMPDSAAARLLSGLGAAPDAVRLQVLLLEGGEVLAAAPPAPPSGLRENGTAEAAVPLPSPEPEPEEMRPPEVVALSEEDRDRLSGELALVFPDPDKAKAFLKKAGFPVAQMPFPVNSSAMGMWEALLDEIGYGIVQDGFRLLLGKALGRYPGSKVFQLLAEKYGVAPAA
ncbi:Clp protease N-terminal domain-containing protein [Nocardiopsis algeriensis]|uniref:ATP-dependent Clp protease ATP-binding subunit ClpA n=1 Tax=Nocardiopsis algeriensis TaxID=1478215 RepID=A0A841IKH4_9ACTN|nr:Clp protease N-terminal domain-containing protein [Nocardiopsis algeriensis]MBB6118572.1 ATP-dependent Clp protease ATP-binding subunit ClpA [Nocardiopsis algeriensis]